MTVADVARALEVSPTTVYALCEARKLGHHRVGLGRGSIRISAADLAAYLAGRRVEPAAPRPATSVPAAGWRSDATGAIDAYFAARRRGRRA